MENHQQSLQAFKTSAKISAPAFIILLKVQKLMYEMQLDVLPSKSKAIEFMYDVMLAYQNKTRLDVANWRPRTRRARHRNEPALFRTKTVEELDQQIEHLENVIRNTRARRIANLRYQRSKQNKKGKQVPPV